MSPLPPPLLELQLLGGLGELCLPSNLPYFALITLDCFQSHNNKIKDDNIGVLSVVRQVVAARTALHLPSPSLPAAATVDFVFLPLTFVRPGCYRVCPATFRYT